MKIPKKKISIIVCRRLQQTRDGRGHTPSYPLPSLEVVQRCTAAAQHGVEHILEDRALEEVLGTGCHDDDGDFAGRSCIPARSLGHYGELIHDGVPCTEPLHLLSLMAVPGLATSSLVVRIH